ncbi:YlxP-like protein [hydrothermal vent metagenome]|uniref:YlxP-like protein n=1 Tax=hydrothermal vent metagenome TaxID=652676 RepID=A0A3B0XI39_9ZZZZ
MHILLIKLNLHIPNAHSLKEKRREIKSLKDRLNSRFNASVAEVDHLDSWQQSVIAMCLLSVDKSYLDKQFSLIEAVVLEYAELELISADREWL